MGIIIAKFRKSASTFDILTKLENEIVSIEEFQKRTQQTQRKIVFRFLILAILIYAALAFLLYLYFSQISQNQKLLWSIPLIAFPLVIWLIKIFLTWYYTRKIRKNENKLVTLKEKKKQILENVMETETYKVAKKILDKFANESKKPPVIATPQRATPLPSTVSKTSYETVLRQRTLAAQSGLKGRISYGGPPDTPVAAQRQLLALPTPVNRRSINTPVRPLAISPPTGPSLARSILPRDRSVLDKMVDYLVGDGPSNRYALICQNCSSHNGMALKEEFEYLAFRCCYCNVYNPSRKKRPVGPKFDSPLMLTPAKTVSQAESSDSEGNSENDSDSESKPIIEEPRSDSPDTAKTSDYEKVSDSELLGDDSMMAGDDSKMAGDDSMMAGDDSKMAGDNSKMDVDDSHNHQTVTAKGADLTEGGDAAAVVDSLRDVSDK